MPKSSTLLQNFKGSYDGKNWYADSLKNILKDVDGHLAFTAPPGKRNSIASLLHHMMSWKKLAIRQMQGDKNYTINQKASFSLKEYGRTTEKAWEKLLKQYDQTHQELMQLLKKADKKLLAQKVTGRNFTLQYLINGVLQHDIYHTGQIALLKQQLKQLKKGKKAK
jgi:uncharacterized damage-inducible protein DinB